MMTHGTKLILSAFLLMIGFAGQSALAKDIDGAVMVAGQPMRGATVTLWRTTGAVKERGEQQSIAQVFSQRR